jgi:hypothetical protein
MSRDRDDALPPFNPNDIASDSAWLPLCSPQDRLTYMAAKGVYDEALATAAQAIAAANLARDQAIAKESAAFDSATAALAALARLARAALAALSKLWGSAVDPADPGSAKQSGDAADVAQAQCDIAIAAATATKDRAENVFDGVRFALWTKLNDQN